jgi:hypothetical protein
LAAGTTRQQILVLHASKESEIDSAFATLAQQHAGSLLVQTDPFLFIQRDKIITLAARYALTPIRQAKGATIGTTKIPHARKGNGGRAAAAPPPVRRQIAGNSAAAEFAPAMAHRIADNSRAHSAYSFRISAA